MIETPTREVLERAATHATDEVQLLLAELNQLARFYQEGLLSEQELQAAKEKHLQGEDESPPMDSLWF